MAEKKEACTHCWCIDKAKGLHGAKCQKPYTECCKCGEKMAAKVNPFDEFKKIYPPNPPPQWAPPVPNNPKRGDIIWCDLSTGITAQELGIP